MPQAFSSTSVLAGARDLNTGNPLVFGAEDMGGKIAQLLSFANLTTSALSFLTAAVSQLQAVAVSAAGSGLTFSAFSTAPSALIGLGSFPGNWSNLKA